MGSQLCDCYSTEEQNVPWASLSQERTLYAKKKKRWLFGGYKTHQDIILKSISLDNYLLSESRYLGYNFKPAKI